MSYVYSIMGVHHTKLNFLVTMFDCLLSLSAFPLLLLSINTVREPPEYTPLTNKWMYVIPENCLQRIYFYLYLPGDINQFHNNFIHYHENVNIFKIN